MHADEQAKTPQQVAALSLVLIMHNANLLKRALYLQGN